MDVATFRANFAEFNSTTAYPDSLINFWLGVGGRQLNTCQWGNMLDDGLQLFTAHHVTIAARDKKTAAFGGAPGGNSGPLASKAVDKVSASYDTTAAIEEGAGHWNLTTYGTQFIRLAKMLGAGGIQLGGSLGPVLAPGGFPFDPFNQ